MKRSAKKRLQAVAACLLLTAFALLAAYDAFARVGGGQSYSGGGGGGGGGYGGGYGGSYSGSGGGGAIVELIFQLFRGLFYLTIYHPLIGVPIDVGLLLAIRYFFKHENEFTFSTTSTSPGASFAARIRQVNISERFRQLRELDPAFSRALFTDFCYSLFAEAHKARGQGRIDDLSSYFSEPARNGFREISREVKSVDGIVIGACTIERVSLLGPQVQVSVRFEANYTETQASGAKQSWYANELWSFVRHREARSRPPETIRQITCPNCGAPPGNDGQNRCPSCGASNSGGKLAWFVENRSASREERPPLLTENVPEVGTDLPTLYDPEFREEEGLLAKTQPDFNWQRFEERARKIFLELEKAWSDRRWEGARPFETDSMFQTHAYWINEYTKQHLVNRLSDVKIDRFVPVKIDDDQYYSAITARIYATMDDSTFEVTRNAVGKKICGGPRRFSEYWTFIRGKGRGARAKAKALGNDLACPACGAELKISMAGHCEFCGAKITSGEFDWVLSLIEQDEAYTG